MRITSYFTWHLPELSCSDLREKQESINLMKKIFPSVCKVRKRRWHPETRQTRKLCLIFRDSWSEIKWTKGYWVNSNKTLRRQVLFCNFTTTGRKGAVALIVTIGICPPCRCVVTSGERKDVTISIPDTCRRGYTMCRDGECIQASQMCDGVAQCRDRSDEDPRFCRGDLT